LELQALQHTTPLTGDQDTHMAITQALLTSSTHTTSLLRMPPLIASSGTVPIMTVSFVSRRRVPNLWAWHFVSRRWLWPPQTLTRTRASFGLTPLTDSRSCITSNVSSFDGLGHWLLQVSAQFATWLRDKSPCFAPLQRS
jgi:hypothetical protein